jgi:simple sugar transport system permease protein
MGPILLLVNGCAVLLLALSPWFVVKRDFGGVAALVGPFGLFNPQELSLPPQLDLGWITGLMAVWGILLVIATVTVWVPSPSQRARLLVGLGITGILLWLMAAVWFHHTISSVNQAALAEGVSAARLPLKRANFSLGSYTAGFYALALVVLGRLHLPGGRAWLVRYRQVVVPLVSMALAILVGALLIGVIRPGLGAEGVELSGLGILTTRIDLVTYTFQLLFSPLTNLAGLLQSLVLATPLIFTGLAVAFGFHAGLFNIGAPGQLIMGAIATTLVGVYLPGPGWLVLPLAIAAAALGGAVWGSIPGWLKARFGTHEVINTIMMNYIASSLFLFLISSNEYSFFGQTVALPFKAPGLEARSFELQPAARIPLLITLLGISGSGSAQVSLALPIALITALATYLLTQSLAQQQRWLLACGSALAGYWLGGILPGIPLEVSPELTSVRLNGSFLIALLAVGLVNTYLWRTRGGYELRATGLSPKAAEYAGVNLAQKTVLAMAIAGSLAGLAATHYVLGSGIDEYRLKQALPASVGFDGIAVALMGQNSPLGILLTSLLFGVLLTGGLQINLELGISRELVTTLQALIVLFIAAGGFLPSYFRDPLQAAQVELESSHLQSPELVSSSVTQ